jgi:hypothetical protein
MLALAFLAAHAVQAQEPVLANIPFAFTAGKMALPAGECRVQESAQGSFMLLIQRTDRTAATFVISNAVEVNRPQAHCKLIFHRYGNRYYLSQIWVKGQFAWKETRAIQREGTTRTAGTQRSARPGHDCCPPHLTQALVLFHT